MIRHSRWFRAAWRAGRFCVALLLLAGALRAQEPRGTSPRGSAVVQGVAVDVASGRPIPRARVTISGADLVRTTDDAGQFVLDSLPPGIQTLEVRAIGYRPAHEQLSLTAGGRVTVRIEMLAIPMKLDTVRTRASAQDIAGYEQRRNARIGTYFDRADIARMKVFDPTDVLRHALNVKIDFAPGAPSVKTGPGLHPKCDPDLWIDGRWRRGVFVGEMDNFVPLDQIEHIEIYADPAFIPSEFINLRPDHSTSCGAVLVWTAVPPRKDSTPP